MKNKSFILISSISFVNTILLMFISYFLLNDIFVYGDELSIIKETAIFKNLILGMEEKPSKDDYIFINVDNDKQLTEKYDSFGFPIGNQAITDRKKLAKLFSIFNSKPKNQKFILCDVFFKDKSPNDSILESELKKSPNTIISYHFATPDSLDLPIFDVNRGISDYETVKRTFLKFKLFYNDTLKSTPLLMYEQIHNTEMIKNGPHYILGGNYVFNNFILNLGIRNYDLFTSEDRYNIVNLGEFLYLPDTTILSIVKDRIVIIGDFSDRDLHLTIYGKIAGPLILTNAYIAIKEGDNIIHLSFILYLILGYFFISYFVIHPDNIILRIISKKIDPSELIKDMINILSYMALLYTLSIISYFVYNIHLNILYLTIYLYALEHLIHFIREVKSDENKNKTTYAVLKMKLYTIFVKQDDSLAKRNN